MDLKVPLLLAHEMVGVDEAHRGGCEFGIFFNYDATPMDLLQRGIFNSIATPLKGGPWRKASMVMLAAGLEPPDDDGRDAVETVTAAKSALEARRHLGQEQPSIASIGKQRLLAKALSGRSSARASARVMPWEVPHE